MNTPVDTVDLPPVSSAPPATGAQRSKGRRPRLLYLVTEDWYFCSHRLPVARAARDMGYEVVVATRITDDREKIEHEGFRVRPLSWRRGSLHPLREIGALREIVRVYREEQPALVHQVAIKPAVYGSLAARFAGHPPTVNMVAGLGYVFTSRDFKARVLGALLRIALRGMLREPDSRLIFQNPDDERVLNEVCRPRPGQMILIRGSGVDVDVFTPRPEPSRPTVTMVARMLWNKGVGDLVEASRLLRERGKSVRVRVVGAPDFENPSSISEAQLRAWNDEGVIEWEGRREDIDRVWEDTTIAVLPTAYGEGVPKALLEAAATGRPIVATDTAGCREIVRHKENGLLVPVGDPQALAGAITDLLSDPEMRRAMGMRGRRLVESEFTEKLVVQQTLDVYRSLHAIHD